MQTLDIWLTFVKHVTGIVWELPVPGQDFTGVTFYDTAIDFELSTGYDILDARQAKNTTWAKKA